MKSRKPRQARIDPAAALAEAFKTIGLSIATQRAKVLHEIGVSIAARRDPRAAGEWQPVPEGLRSDARELAAILALACFESAHPKVIELARRLLRAAEYERLSGPAWWQALIAGFNALMVLGWTELGANDDQRARKAVAIVMGPVSALGAEVPRKLAAPTEAALKKAREFVRGLVAPASKAPRVQEELAKMTRVQPLAAAEHAQPDRVWRLGKYTPEGAAAKFAECVGVDMREFRLDNAKRPRKSSILNSE